MIQFHATLEIPHQDYLKNRRTDGCFGTMNDHPVHATPTKPLPTWMFFQTLFFFQIILVAKWLVCHFITSTTAATTFVFYSVWFSMKIHSHREAEPKGLPLVMSCHKSSLWKLSCLNACIYMCLCIYMMIAVIICILYSVHRDK